MTYDYDLLVVGGGAAGLTAAETGRLLGLRVALIEQHKLGGDCTWYGCVPSKTLLACARRVHEARHAAAYGVVIPSVSVNFAAVMAHVRQIIQHIYDDEAPEVWRARGLDVYVARAEFVDAHHLVLSSGETLRGHKIVLAIGAANIVLDALRDVPYLTHRTLFDLTELPAHLLIVGGGAISVEMAQAFARLGSAVTILTQEARLLDKADPEASALITQVLQAEGIGIIVGRRVQAATHNNDTGVTLTLDNSQAVSGSHVLAAVGKRPDVSALQPHKAGLAVRDGALVLSSTLQTSQPHIYAAGDLAGAPYYTHSAGSEATAVMLNLLLPFKSRHQTDAPYTLFTSPELAQAGLTEQQARQRYRNVQVTRLPLSASDRAMIESATEGFIKLVHGRYGRLYGATIVGVGAGEMMNEWAQVITKKGRVFSPLFATHIYPTLGYANALPGIEFLRHLTTKNSLVRRVQRVLRWWWRR